MIIQQCYGDKAHVCGYVSMPNHYLCDNMSAPGGVAIDLKKVLVKPLQNILQNIIKDIFETGQPGSP